jgi:predicted glutamine amidotransferase
MNRLVAIITGAPYELGQVLREAPAHLLAAHTAGAVVGLAAHEGSHGYDWALQHRARARVVDSDLVRRLAHARGRVLIVAARADLDGRAASPCQRGAWVLAHDGELREPTWLLRHISPDQLDETDTQSPGPLLLAYFLSRLEEAGLALEPPSRRTDGVLRRAVLALDEHGGGAPSLLLSNGDAIYVHRGSAALHLLDRAPTDADLDYAEESGELPIERRRALVVATEPLTREPWAPIEAGTILRLGLAGGAPSWLTVD